MTASAPVPSTSPWWVAWIPVGEDGAVPEVPLDTLPVETLAVLIGDASHALLEQTTHDGLGATPGEAGRAAAVELYQASARLRIAARRCHQVWIDEQRDRRPGDGR